MFEESPHSVQVILRLARGLDNQVLRLQGRSNAELREKEGSQRLFSLEVTGAEIIRDWRSGVGQKTSPPVTVLRQDRSIGECINVQKKGRCWWRGLPAEEPS